MTWTRDRVGALLAAIGLALVAAIWIAAIIADSEKLFGVGLIVGGLAVCLSFLWLWLADKEDV